MVDYVMVQRYKNIHKYTMSRELGRVLVVLGKIVCIENVMLFIYGKQFVL